MRTLRGLTGTRARARGVVAHLLNSVRKRVARLRRFPVLVRRRNAYFLLDPGNWIDNRLLAGAPYENGQLAMARSLIEQRRLETVIDIGANFGLYTILLAALPAVSRVIAFEPVARNYAQLQGNVFANRLWAKVEAHRLALGAEPATAVINIDPRSTGVSRLDVTTANRDPAVFTQREDITIARLDDVVGLAGARCFVKIDVEGKAHEVLAGMARFLAGNEVVLQIELSDQAERTQAKVLLDPLGYREIAAIDADIYFARESESVANR